MQIRQRPGTEDRIIFPADTANGSMSASASTLSKMMMVHEHVWLQNEMVITPMTVMRWCYWLPPSAMSVVALWLIEPLVGSSSCV